MSSVELTLLMYGIIHAGHLSCDSTRQLFIDTDLPAAATRGPMGKNNQLKK